jgi:LytR cell envelope-related transcriptional attenuator
MSTKGRHSGEPGNFYRDLGIMVGGILGVGAIVCFVLFLFGRDTTSETTTTNSTTTTTSSTVPGETTTTDPSTTSTDGTTTTTGVPVRPNDEVRVVVLNSLGISGVAGRFTQTLDDEGYQTLEAGDYRPEQDPTQIWYREGFSAEANSLAAFMLEDSGTVTEVVALPDPTLEPGADLIVVLGTGYQE